MTTDGDPIDAEPTGNPDLRPNVYSALQAIMAEIYEIEDTDAIVQEWAEKQTGRIDALTRKVRVLCRQLQIDPEEL